MHDIYKMDLHELRPAGSTNATVMRVAGGWIYFSAKSAAFVPWHNEFMPGNPPLEHLEL